MQHHVFVLFALDCLDIVLVVLRIYHHHTIKMYSRSLVFFGLVDGVFFIFFPYIGYFLTLHNTHMNNIPTQNSETIISLTSFSYRKAHNNMKFFWSDLWTFMNQIQILQPKLENGAHLRIRKVSNHVIHVRYQTKTFSNITN